MVISSFISLPKEAVFSVVNWVSTGGSINGVVNVNEVAVVM